MVLVHAPPALAFEVFTEQIDRWWRSGLKYRVGGKGRSVVLLEPGLGGRLMERVPGPSGDVVYETGQITAWDPPRRLVLRWRAVNFAPEEHTEVEVLFTPSASGTQVSVIHRGWSFIRADHPARHGQDSRAFLRGLGLWWGDLLRSLHLVHEERGGAA